MGITFDNARLGEVLKSGKDCRMKQLESDFAAWQEYKELANEKDRLLKSLEQQVSGSIWDVLQVQDDFNSLMVCKAQDYFYDKGFNDCLCLVKLVLDNGSKAAQTTNETNAKKPQSNPAEELVYP